MKFGTSLALLFVTLLVASCSPRRNDRLAEPPQSYTIAEGDNLNVVTARLCGFEISELDKNGAGYWRRWLKPEANAALRDPARMRQDSVWGTVVTVYRGETYEVPRGLCVDLAETPWYVYILTVALGLIILYVLGMSMEGKSNKRTSYDVPEYKEDAMPAE